ncbi:nickel pincer cofactor-dependent isomerase, group 22 [Horticoccus sp. 23ND18S-11]|uniref:DUF2088 domain-containing protein n=1 Tax=Horticoccus sp. 23ND18S-11 TaxID=3391832 RepID=UPI0039C9219F
MSAPLPTLQRLRVTFPAEQVEDIGRTVRDQINGLSHVPDGARIAIAVGSRGIANLSTIVRATVDTLKAQGATVFIVPAMGSHGGATAAGQRDVLAGYGVTEEAMGCPILATMDVVELPARDLEHPLFLDRHAAEADGIVLINRIKPHTDFHGRYESGLVKMAIIGLGKEAAALALHRFGVRGLRDLIPRAAAQLLATGRILFGLAIVENAYEATALIEAIPGNRILDREPILLAVAYRQQPSLPLEDIDVLVVDRLGKNISGTGMDTNIIGRLRIAGESEPNSPRIKMILVTDLTDESHGNAVGTGLADIITTRLAAKIDHRITYINVATSGFLERGKVPLAAPTDAAGLELALRASGCLDPATARVIRIRDTLHLGEILASPAAVAALGGRDHVTVIGEPRPAVDAVGRLLPFEG